MPGTHTFHIFRNKFCFSNQVKNASREQIAILLHEQDIVSIYNTLSKANIFDQKIREEHTKGLKAQIEKTSVLSTRSICNQPVTEKVKLYCLGNKKFKGKIYCFEHQKTIHDQAQ
ncbi:hypothetical protein [Lederbergia panacisoli]|uniref:hypothetical protein n=1 Tax=Lederbergia panacisoli TaxID=1255251 RepID=UPI00214C4607|nr:hypothetical protein [Lederbergia panacisoli]MCR2822971.1 hypothetical protein [Lederbergia panacisoli]